MASLTVLARPTRQLSVRCIPASMRFYHDESFGFRKPREFTLPDYSPEQLRNRTANAPLMRYVDSLRTHGHRAARIDPLDLLQREEVAALDPTRYGLVDPAAKYNINGIIWDKPVGTSSSATTNSVTDSEEDFWTLEEIVRHLRGIYVGRIAYEYMHSPSKTERLWFSHMLESKSATSAEEQDEAKKRKSRIHELLTQSEVFDQFLQAKFPNLKRYGLEGGESMIPALDTLFQVSAQAGVEHIVLGMPHRGRLNLLTGLLEFSPAALFNKIKGGFEFPEELGASGDVISHLVASPSLNYEGATHPVKVSLLPNPSHLEAINPIALGKTRAKQYSLLHTSPDDCMLGDKVMCVQLHGDASFTGQGIVMEGLGLSNLPHFSVGGSVHIVVNNNIGYTTPASGARSSLYCSDIGKMIHAPVLHVNGDHPEDVARAVETAFKYRNHFRKDVIIDLLVYRRWGHNELDEPAFTQPLMYEQIRSRKSVPTLYEEKLVADEVITSSTATSVRKAYKSHLEAELAKSASNADEVPSANMLKDQWSSMVWPASSEAQNDPDTGVEKGVLESVGRASVKVGENFEIHPRLQRHVKHRLQAIESGKGLDWATAEAMAFGSIMLEGNDIRISGQDVGRGTFSQRHAMFVDQKTEQVTVPLNVELDSKGRLELANSSLSEMAVLGFEYGLSWEKPNMLPIWEAQFGDFFNGAQIIIDTFISSSETKWLKQSGLVMLLPHGLDGAGPEHSSSRIERFLQLTNDRYSLNDEPTNINMHVVFPTTPAQYFHLLRRQVKRNYRKPLIVAGPKGLLRLPAAASLLSELTPSTRFQPVLREPLQPENLASIKRVILCTGKIYHDLVKQRQSLSLESQVSIIRIEELAPFPFTQLRQVLEEYGSNPSVYWVQEEPRNQGAWGHVSSRIESVMEDLGIGRLRFVGRKEEAVPAPGVGKLYKQQQETILNSAFEGL
ncbi:dehydrogenase E1 and transketolase domain-containing protein 1 [Stereum hirsutum FP-91666 SS1]|uniref:dehydrogenase E1 and transketolase domain-containing protein 1 n=1 Tax=Stereum hirsutum (strain FP-91666) TaxID=721885 RepID=UPI000440B842|nr:dehydrogenase E1 and transketolase domain-containing protein 1 [Stereum hirsutum FP-91666 SS1]EIM89258.1 dehydrogenase E1 and transketolase domain-containing protein 1 [Stereum hirsutum FP-91666 SS1]